MSLSVLGALRSLDEPRHRAELYRAWATAHSGGLSHQVALDGLPSSRSAHVEALRRALAFGTRQQKPVGVIVKTHPALLSSFEAAVLVAGDESNQFGTALPLLTDWFARESKRQLRVRLLMGYPIFFGVIASFAATLPVLYRKGRNAYVVGIGVALVTFASLGGILLDLLAGAELGRRNLTTARFARALAGLLSMGIPRGRAVRLAVDASGSVELRRHIAPRSERELQTMPLAKLLTGCRAVPAALMSQVSVADATGEYQQTMLRYAESVEAEEA